MTDIPLAARLNTQGIKKSGHGMFCCRIRRAFGYSGESGQTGNGDQLTFRLFQVRKCGRRTPDTAKVINAHECLKNGKIRDSVKWTTRTHAGVVDQNIQLAKVGNGFGNDAMTVGLDADVAENGHRVSTVRLAFGDNRLQAVYATGTECDAGARLGKLTGEFSANTAWRRR